MKQTIVGAVLLVLTSILIIPSTSLAKKVQYRKVQDVKFDAADINGNVRNPDGAYVVQKRGIDFMPLYKVRKSFDDNIRESVDFVN